MGQGGTWGRGEAWEVEPVAVWARQSPCRGRAGPARIGTTGAGKTSDQHFGRHTPPSTEARVEAFWRPQCRPRVFGWDIGNWSFDQEDVLASPRHRALPTLRGGSVIPEKGLVDGVRSSVSARLPAPHTRGVTGGRHGGWTRRQSQPAKTSRTDGSTKWQCMAGLCDEVRPRHLPGS